MAGEGIDEDAPMPFEIRSTGQIQFYDPVVSKQVNFWVQTAHRDPTRADSIIAEIEELRRSRPHLDWQLAGAIRYVLSAVDRWDDLIAFQVKELDRYPEEVLEWISLANNYRIVMGDLEKAEETIRGALDLARAQNDMVRCALHDLARIFVERGDYAQLCVTLEEIMTTTPSPGDVGRERDFVDRLPSGAIPSELLARYNAFRPQRPSDRPKGKTKRKRTDGPKNKNENGRG